MKQILSLLLACSFFTLKGQLPMYNYSSGTWNTTNMSINYGLRTMSNAAFQRAMLNAHLKRATGDSLASRRSNVRLPRNRPATYDRAPLPTVDPRFHRSFSCQTCDRLASRGSKSSQYYKNFIIDFDTELLLNGMDNSDFTDILSQSFAMAWGIRNSGRTLNRQQMESLKGLVREAMQRSANHMVRGSREEKQKSFEYIAITTMQMMKFNQSASTRYFAINRAKELMTLCLKPLNINQYKLEGNGFVKAR